MEINKKIEISMSTQARMKMELKNPKTQVENPKKNPTSTKNQVELKDNIDNLDQISKKYENFKENTVKKYEINVRFHKKPNL